MLREPELAVNRCITRETEWVPGAFDIGVSSKKTSMYGRVGTVIAKTKWLF